jgi:exodeoxyribonuclease-3
MKIVSFNINSVRARIHQVEQLIALHDPDVIGLQETKVHDDEFPFADLEHLGYHIEVHGQKGHYGVAMLSKKKPLSVQKGFVSDDEEAQRRMIMGQYESASGKVYTILNGYFPQGESEDHETKFPAKRKFYEDLQTHLESELKGNDAVVVIGDLNIASTDLDIGIGADNAKRWLRTKKCSFLPIEREWFERLVGFGLFDTFRQIHPAVDDRFSWFDYRSKGFDREPKRGLRIDALLASNALQDSLKDSAICYETRAMEKPSDHAPIWAEFSE